MPRMNRRVIAALLATAATYFYFLLFAEFAFLELASQLVGNAAGLRVVMGVLGCAGVAGGIAAAATFSNKRGDVHLRWAFRLCAGAALVALPAPAAGSATLVLVAAALAGGSLGALTVTLAALLRGALGGTRLGLGIGAGTGAAYAACNAPWVFHASPAVQTALAATAVTVASLLPGLGVTPVESSPPARRETLRWTGILLALVWLDSAAFYIIQHTATLRAGTWERTDSLVANALMHFAVAVFAGWCLDRGARAWVAAAAVAALALAALQLNGTLPALWAANGIYTAGVSLYSVVLVEFPARFGRPGLAALVFGVAGWLGSALGIGLAQDLARIPTLFVAAAFATVLLALAWRTRKVVLLAALGAVAAGPTRADDDVALGREVYIAEGCLHCHSQYLRPRVASEVLNWGPAMPLRQTLAAAPPLIGTRRQGPDLSRVGNRRSAEWNRLHLIAPQAVSPGSRMPSYAHLFAPDESRGEALLAYLASLGAETIAARREQVAAWTPATGEVLSLPKAGRLYGQLCAQCHGGSGRGDGPLLDRLHARPPNWARDPWRHVRPGQDEELAISRIIKFGLPGLPMAGHEYLPDSEIVGLARHVRMLHQSQHNAASQPAPP